MKPNLKDVTLMCADCVNLDRAINVLERCKSLCDFGAVKFLTHFETGYEHKVAIPKLENLNSYSVFMLAELWKHIDTSHVLVVQGDGFIINPQSWDDKWLEYDYIGPLFVQYDIVGSGGFSMRSKNIMAEAGDRVKWDGTIAHANRITELLGAYEDGFLSMHINRLFKIAPLEEAAKFAQGGNKGGKYYVERPFGFHGGKQNIDIETGFVYPICRHNGENCLCTYSLLDYLTKHNL